MKLAKYLADYIASESVLIEPYSPETGEIEFIIQQGLEAFASTEDVRVEVIAGNDNNVVERIA